MIPLVAKVFDQFGRTGRWLISPVGSRLAVVALLTTQTGLLGYSATRHSPTFLEPAFLASGISHWQFGRFELYRVNPPLVRMVAALPVLAVGCKTDWNRFYDGPGSRAEFAIGEDFIKANGPASIPLFFYARWACIPFNLIGSYFAYRWAKDLYGGGAGLLTMTLYVFEPNLLAHGELITPDGACTSFGILAGYTFWRWLKQPTWTRALLAGGALGLAELSKMSSLILLALWPALWLTWRTLGPSEELGSKPESHSPSTYSPMSFPSSITPHSSAFQLAVILLSALYILNLGYAFDGSFTRLKDLNFVSTTLTGLDKPGESGNRFRASLLGELQIPLPKHYVLGLDSQKKDFEHFSQQSYLCGEWKDGGWWYYYLYGLLVKVPCGTWGLILIILLWRPYHLTRPAVLRDELVLLVPAICLLVLVSSQTEFNHHLRYVYPSLALILIWAGQVAEMGRPQMIPETTRFRTYTLSSRCPLLVNLATMGLTAYSMLSALSVYPHHLAYFNDFVGGPRNGPRHLLGSNVDWGQDILYLHDYLSTRQLKVYLHVRQPTFEVCRAVGIQHDQGSSIEVFADAAAGKHITQGYTMIGFSLIVSK